MKLDAKQRLSLARVDDERRQRKITTARSIIYEKKYALDSEAVEKILKEESLVPTLVSKERLETSFADERRPECFLDATGSVWLFLFSDVSS